MIDEKDIHVRNVKLISSFFIMYWLLDLTPSGDNIIRLPFISYEVHNLEALPWLANVALIYFVWRFWLSTRKVGKFRNHFVNLFRSKLKDCDIKNTNSGRRLVRKAEAEAKKFIRESASQTFERISPKLTAEQIDNILSAPWKVREFTLPSGGGYNKAKNLFAIIQWEIKVNNDQFFTYPIDVKLNSYMFSFKKMQSFFLAVFNEDRFATYTLSWILFFFAVLCSALILIDFSPRDLVDKLNDILSYLKDIQF